MKKIGNGLYINPININSARVFEKDGKQQACFTMKQGEPVFTDKYDTLEQVEKIIATVLE